MKALTLWQPWSWAIAHAGKRVENRTWAPPKSIIGQRVAIHAGLRLDKDGDIAICQMTTRSLPGIYVHGAVESVATIAGYVKNMGFAGAGPPHTDAYYTEWADGMEPITTQSVVNSPWWVGPIGWVLTDVIALPEPVPCKGMQGLWMLPADVESAVLAQVGAP